MSPQQQPDRTMVPTATTACCHSNSITPPPLLPPPPALLLSHLAAVHDLQLRGLTPLWGPGPLGGDPAARRGLRLRDPAGERQHQAPLAPGGQGTLHGDRATATSAEAQEKRAPRHGKMRHPAPQGSPHPRALPGEDGSTGGLAKQDGSGTAPRPGAGSDVTRSSCLGLLDPGIGPGSQRCGEKSGGLSPGPGGQQRGGGSNAGEEPRRHGLTMHTGVCYLRRGSAHRHAHTQTVTCPRTRASTALWQPPRDTGAWTCTCTRPADPHTRVCAPTCRQAALVPATAHTHAQARASRLPPVPAGPVTCTGRRSPCQAGRAACAARCGGRSRAPAPAPVPAVCSAAGRWAGRSPLQRAARHPPAAPTPGLAAPAAQSPILCVAGASLCPHLALGQRGHCPGCPLHRGSRRSGGPSPAHSGSARGCCTPERVTLSLRPWQTVTSSAWRSAPHSPRAHCTCSGTAGHPAQRCPGSGAGGRPARGRGVSAG